METQGVMDLASEGNQTSSSNGGHEYNIKWSQQSLRFSKISTISSQFLSADCVARKFQFAINFNFSISFFFTEWFGDFIANLERFLSAVL